MEQIIKNDPTLNFFINEANIDWNNEFQVDLRCTSLKIALAYYLNNKYGE